MAKKAEKEDLKRLQEQFLRDLARLSAEYENQELGLLTGLHPTNLSRYKTKPPGIQVLRKFYAGLTGIIDNPFEKTNLDMKENKENKDPESGSREQKSANEQKSVPPYDHGRVDKNEVNEPGVVPIFDESEAGLKKELFATLRSAIAHHRNIENKMLDGSDKLFSLPYKWLDSFDKMVSAHTLNNQMALATAESQKMMVAAFLKKLGLEDPAK